MLRVAICAKIIRAAATIQQATIEFVMIKEPTRPTSNGLADTPCSSCAAAGTFSTFTALQPATGAKASISIRIAFTNCIATQITVKFQTHRSPVETDVAVESGVKLPHREIFHKRFFKKFNANFRLYRAV